MPLALSVIIPAYNESKRIGDTLRGVHAYLEKSYLDRYEIVVVDDGSTDATCAVVRQMATIYSTVMLVASLQNRGKGAAVAQGMLAAQGDVRLFMDADNATTIRELEKLSPFLAQGYAVIAGSRALPESVLLRHQPRLREYIGRMGNWVIQRLLVGGIEDTQCGFKIFSREAAEKIFSNLRTHRWAFDVEALMRANAYGFRIKEVPVVWQDSAQDSKMAHIRSYLSMAHELVCLLPLRLRLVTQQPHRRYAA